MTKERIRQEDPAWIKRSKKKRRKAARVAERLTIPGVGSVTRTGRHVLLEAKRTPGEQLELTRRLAAEHPKVEAEIQRHVDALSTGIPQFDPLVLLHRAYTDFFLGMLGKEGEHEVGFSGVIDMRMLDYVHSIIVSRPPRQQIPLDDEHWSDLRHHVTALYGLLLERWPSTQSAVRRLSPDYGSEEDDEEHFRIPLLLDWLFVRGSRYTIHERERMEALLAPHDPLLQASFGTEAKTIAQAVEEIQRRLTLGLGEAMQAVLEIHREAVAGSASGSSADATERGALRAAALADRPGRKEELEGALGRAFGRALFDVTDLLPDSLLRAISLEAGEDSRFFATKEHAGWPLTTPPTSRRPVLRRNGRYYIFNPFVTDNFYRAVELAVVSADASARQLWNEGQKEATEALPVKILSEMLPHATVYRDVEYPFQDEGRKKWCECDAVFLLDGLLLAVEVKGGRAPDASPLHATGTHLASVRRLLIAPTQQADRFIRYVESAPEVTLFDSSRTEVGRVRRDDIELSVRCAVTADSMAHVSGLFQHATAATSGDPVPPSWCVSVDNLFAYRDVLRHPTYFRHFLTYRLQAFHMSALAPLDELDHLGAYLETNAYVDWIGEMGGNLVGLHGYRAKLDQYFGNRWETGEALEPPSQRLPPVLHQLIEKLEQSRPRGFLRAGGALLHLNGSARKSLASLVLQARSGLEPRRSRVVTPFSGGDASPVYIGVASEHDTPSAHHETHLDHALSQMVVSEAREGVLIDASVAIDGTVTDADCTLLSLDGLSEGRRRQLASLAERIAASRFQKAREAGMKIGRNDLCLCGSGRKHKRCCLKKGLR